jgi:hypothetical protein
MVLSRALRWSTAGAQRAVLEDRSDEMDSVNHVV